MPILLQMVTFLGLSQILNFKQKALVTILQSTENRNTGSILIVKNANIVYSDDGIFHECIDHCSMPALYFKVQF